MADEMVRQAQEFINNTYGGVPGIPTVEEDGRTKWAVMYALTRALQYELGIDALSDNFGPTTLSTLRSRYPAINANVAVPLNIVKIVQSGLWCKGYPATGTVGGVDGDFSDTVASSVTQMQRDMGVASAYPAGTLTPKVFKGLLNMDPYVRTVGGTDTVRGIEQWLNGRYVDRADYFIIPCDGHYSRSVQKALMLAIQYEIGMADGVANGNFGPGTKAGLKSHPLTVGDTGVWVRLFSAALVFNRRSGATFTSSYSTTLAGTVRTFQDFVRLNVNGNADYPTWASLLVSYGDDTRKGTAFDCADTVTSARAKTLSDNGYKLGGRYLTNVPGTDLDKVIKPGELTRMAAAGISCFPIYQTSANYADYFHRAQGTSDAIAATVAARNHGFKKGTRIYFAIDYDNTDDEITSGLIPHFRGINEGIVQAGNYYRVGIYATRNACSRVAAEGLSGSSFVSDMSSGYSGNLGFPMPEDWAIDQIKTITLGSGDGRIEIDNNINSGREAGQNTFDTPPAADDLDVRFDYSWEQEFYDSIQDYLSSKGIPPEGPPEHWHGWYEPAVTPRTVYTTRQCVDFLLSADELITSLARMLKIRKTLIQIPALWEMRHKNDTEFFDVVDTPLANDTFSDACVYGYHNGVDGAPDWVLRFIDKIVEIRDASTGVGQIFAKFAIAARNHAIDLGLLDASKRDAGNDAHIWTVWEKLHYNDAYNVSTIPYMHIYHASTIGLSRPGLTTGEADTEKLLIRYQGALDNPDAVAEGKKRMGLYRVIEDNYNKVFREMSARRR
ncbi:glycoside hydrolase domain-containing protein [Streptomyces sp. MAR4 CNX-425]|uniref:glycoside hydrolase domain-containing protein n=1 Tax=Streptomyces sp. MAR4 CNX-425 TaxID=3406343 RepID=UPI003B50E2A0